MKLQERQLCFVHQHPMTAPPPEFWCVLMKVGGMLL
eukprot:CAMPEP_0171602872 /NCGR_PEP_ID=MMETSP0990-20121206/5708_1 /TAXON_ID=483369 /ORGANISM="non described non described, Strain CCMP2098" /LENGTH=35 /DNA_ID= /DNA_START= /DNA_END= /DNA_ORIENTATION=